MESDSGLGNGSGTETEAAPRRQARHRRRGPPDKEQRSCRSWQRCNAICSAPGRRNWSISKSSLRIAKRSPATWAHSALLFRDSEQGVSLDHILQYIGALGGTHRVDGIVRATETGGSCKSNRWPCYRHAQVSLAEAGKHWIGVLLNAGLFASSTTQGRHLLALQMWQM